MELVSKITIEKEARTELHDKLQLTGAEVSINNLPAHTAIPFIHYHKDNEEIYGILSGSGKMIVGNQTIPLAVGDWLRIAPAAPRQVFAADNEELSYICIQVKEASLGNYTADDAVIA